MKGSILSLAGRGTRSDSTSLTGWMLRLSHALSTRIATVLSTRPMCPSAGGCGMKGESAMISAESLFPE